MSETNKISRKDFLKTTSVGLLSLVLLGKFGITANAGTVTDNLRPSGEAHKGPNPPAKTNVLWIDTANGGLTKYFDDVSGTWKPTRSTWYE